MADFATTSTPNLHVSRVCITLTHSSPLFAIIIFINAIFIIIDVIFYFFGVIIIICAFLTARITNICFCRRRYCSAYSKERQYEI